MHRIAMLVKQAGGAADVQHTGGGICCAVFPVGELLLVIGEFGPGGCLYRPEDWERCEPSDFDEIDLTWEDADEVASLILSMQAY
jgi:hypothetical protein